MNNEKYIESSVLGVQVYVDSYVAYGSQLVYVSCFKGNDSVKGALSGFLSNNDFKIGDDIFSRGHGVNFTMAQQKLAENLSYGIAYVKQYFDGNDINRFNVVMGKDYSELRDIIFERLKRLTRVPLHDAWKLDIISDCVEWTNLKTFNIPVAQMVTYPTDEKLEEYVMENLEHLKTLINRTVQ